MVKSLCVRFNLDNGADRKAWEKIHDCNKSANRAIIDAINDSGNDGIAETVRTVLKEFFSAGQPVAMLTPEKQQEKELDLNEIDFDFLGG